MRKIVACWILALATLLACGPAGKSPRVAIDPARSSIDELWEEPRGMAARNLFWGPGGRQMAPDSAGIYQFVAHKEGGRNPGYDVRAPDGRKWSVKLGEEAQSEVVASRVLWAIGFHQPPTYYLAAWTLSGTDAGRKPAGRFRAELKGHRVIGEWSWYRNPFVGTQPFKGLIVAQLILNNWDLKTSNNKIYIAGTGTGSRKEYVVRDLGASLGRVWPLPVSDWLNLRVPGGTRNDLWGFLQQGFIERVKGTHVEFAYRGLDRALVDTVSIDDVRWTCSRLSRLTDEQWRDAFRSADYSEGETTQYVRKIRQKIAQGLRFGPP